MREIKFKAWDKEKKEWAYIDLDNWGESNMNACIGHGNKEYPYMTFSLRDCDRYIWQQFTGLKDKNGKELYEGDIIEYYIENNALAKFLVKWNKEGFWDIGINVLHSKLIGNICENPELLKR